MQNIILFIEPTTSTYYLPSKIGNLYINRFAIAEEERSEILKIFEFQDEIRDLILKKGKGHLKINLVRPGAGALLKLLSLAIPTY